MKKKDIFQTRIQKEDSKIPFSSIDEVIDGTGKKLPDNSRYERRLLAFSKGRENDIHKTASTTSDSRVHGHTIGS